MAIDFNKVALITGATDGIGRATAHGLAQRGFQIIIISRNENKCKDVCRDIINRTGNSNINYYVADLSLMSEVKKVSARIRNDIDTIDILINNVGAVFLDRDTTDEGIERTFALNHLSYFTMTNELIGHLKKNDGARVVNVSSGMHFQGNINFNDLEMDLGYKGFKAYSNSKLMNVLFSNKLSRLYKSSGIISNALHPGFVATKFGHDHNLLFRTAIRCAQFIGAIKPDTGAETSIFLASEDSISSISGEYFYKSKPMRSHELSYSEEDQDILWDMSMEFAYG